MKSKVSLVTAILIVLVVLLSACGANSTKDAAGNATNTTNKQTNFAEEVQVAAKDVKADLELVMWGSEDDKKVMEQRLEIVKQTYPNINVDVNLIASDYDQKVQLMIASGTAPDIMMLAENYQVFAESGRIIPLDNLISSNNVNMQEKYSEDIAALMQYNGQQYAMPDRAGAMILFYNKDMFDKANVAYPSKEWTQKEFLEAAQKLTIKEGGKTVQWGYYPSSWWPQWMQLVYQAGGSLFDENMQPTFNTQSVIDALQFFNDLTYEYGVSPTPAEVADMGNIGPDPMFAQGIIAMETTGFWNIGSLSKVEGINWDIAPIWGETNAFFNGLAITKDSKNQDPAFKVLDALTSVEAQMPIVESGQDAPATKDALNSDQFLNAQYGGKKINMAAFSESRIYKIPLNPKWNEMNKIIDDKLPVLFSNGATAAETAAKIQEGLEELYK